MKTCPVINLYQWKILVYNRNEKEEPLLNTLLAIGMDLNSFDGEIKKLDTFSHLYFLWDCIY